MHITGRAPTSLSIAPLMDIATHQPIVQFLVGVTKQFVAPPGPKAAAPLTLCVLAHPKD
jgi:hypothetical protein